MQQRSCGKRSVQSFGVMKTRLSSATAAQVVQCARARGYMLLLMICYRRLCSYIAPRRLRAARAGGIPFFIYVFFFFSSLSFFFFFFFFYFADVPVILGSLRLPAARRFCALPYLALLMASESVAINNDKSAHMRILHAPECSIPIFRCQPYGERAARAFYAAAARRYACAEQACRRGVVRHANERDYSHMRSSAYVQPRYMPLARAVERTKRVMRRMRR